jgi:hypothetical protein
MDLHTKVIFYRLCEVCKNTNITKITLDFNGSGDCGQIEDIEFFNDKNEEYEKPGSENSICPAVRLDNTTILEGLTWNNTTGWVPILKTKDLTLEEAAERVAYTMLETHHEGWEINDGSQGKITLNLIDKKIFLEISINIIAVETYENETDLSDFNPTLSQIGEGEQDNAQIGEGEQDNG